MKKRIILQALSVLAAVGASAQTIDDALTLGENDYFGTARSIAMGNAFTALGGDLGSVGLNPAASAVNRYNQFSITPGLIFSSARTAYTAESLQGGSVWGSGSSYSRTRPVLSSLGLVYFMPVSHDLVSGLSFGIVSNATSFYAGRAGSSGGNDLSSWSGSLAHNLNADNVDPALFADGYDSRDLYYNEVAAWKTYIVDYDEVAGNYFGAGEPPADMSDRNLTQTYRRQTSGYKNDTQFNFAVNFLDKLYVGVNMGLIFQEYSIAHSFSEVAPDPSLYPSWDDADGVSLGDFKGMAVKELYTMTGTGVNFKIGAIWVPFPFLRLGAAVQTPTWTTIVEQDRISASSEFGARSLSSVSPLSEYSYDLTSPFRYNLGAAFNFGRGVLSVDYERVNYGKLRYGASSSSSFIDDDYEDLNTDIESLYGRSRMLRLGAEVHVMDFLSARAGYTRCSTGTDGQRPVGRSFALGLGYSSAGSFFMDVAFRRTLHPRSYYTPYGEYMAGTGSPEFRITPSRNEFLLTFGWRF